jgi:UDP-2,3-diacylglucosamine pyrophosphatase LpxH
VLIAVLRNKMVVWSSSDWHCDPEELKDFVKYWISLGKAKNYTLIGTGDLFNILPWGEDKWENASSIEQFVNELDGYPFVYVSGNHDPYKTMNRLLAPYPNIKVCKRYESEINSRKYFFTHGHRWAIDWGFLGIRHIAPHVVEFMVDVAPGLWYWFCRKVGWLANEQPKFGEEQQIINNLTRIIWAGASDHAIKNKCCVILGHTHTSGRREYGISKQIGFQAYVVDGGDLQNGTYIEITDDARLKWL